jgi:anti-sigma factor RsiW
MDRVHECRPELVQAYADAQLSVSEALEVEGHLEHCAPCSALYANHRALSGLIAQSSLYHRAPAGLLDRIESELGTGRPPSAPQRTPIARESLWRAIGLAASAAFLIVLIGAFGMKLYGPGREDPAMHDIVANHIRSLMLNHLADVASSDRHTVKPWFNGKLNFSPPVRDFAQQGFPLIGGRIDVVNDDPVAALVYRHNKHYINLFLWPSSRAAQPRQSASRRGYHIIHWTQSGTEYWAISDMSPAALDEFARLNRHNP